MASAYQMRNIDASLWRHVKARAAADGRPIKWIIMRLLALYAGGQVDINMIPTIPTKGGR
jgi:hypothetical protein